MAWLVVDLVLAGLVLALLVASALRLWRRVRALLRQVRAAGDSVTPATDALAAAQAARPAHDA